MNLSVFSPEQVHQLCTQFLFDLFAVHGSPSLAVEDVDAFLKSMESFDASQLVHPYDQALYKILHKISFCQAEGRDKILKTLLLDLPALPPAVGFDFFHKMLTGNSSTAVSFLIAANALMESQPILKPVLLECVLKTCVSEDADTREKGIRLVKNKLHQDAELSQRIEKSASENLNHLVQFQSQGEASTASPAKFCHLYLALCTRKASLLRNLFEVFAQASDDGKRVIHENAKQLTEAVHFLLPELLSLIESVPQGAEPLLLLLLSIFPDRSPPQKVVDACFERYNQSKDVQFLLPILPGLPKKRVMEIVPLLTQLPLPDFAAAVTDLVGQLPFGDASVEPSEVLVALGSSSEAQGNPEELTSVRAALDYCIKHMTAIFDKEVLAGALNKLVHMHTLPVLFMRMVLLSISREKELGTFVLHSVLSASVITSKIKPETTQWQGYLLLLQKMTPESFKHLLTLPTRLMTAALREMPKNFSERFFEFVRSDECDVRVANDAVVALKDFVTDFEAAVQATKSKASTGSPAQHTDREMTPSVQREDVGQGDEPHNLEVPQETGEHMGVDSDNKDGKHSTD